MRIALPVNKIFNVHILIVTLILLLLYLGVYTFHFVTLFHMNKMYKKHALKFVCSNWNKFDTKKKIPNRVGSPKLLGSGLLIKTLPLFALNYSRVHVGSNTN